MPIPYSSLEGIPKGNWNTKRGFASATRFGVDATQSLTRGYAEKTFGIRDGDAESAFFFQIILKGCCDRCIKF